MVHTANFYLNLSAKDVKEIVYRFNKRITLIKDIVDGFFNWSKTKLFFDFGDENQYGRNCWVLQVEVDFIKLLNKIDINDDDYKIIEEEIDKYVYFIFGHTEYKMSFTRIDYRIDAKMNKNDIEVVLKLLTKSYQKYGFKKLKNTKEIIGKEKYEKLIKDNNMKKIETGLYFQSKSIKIHIYDKELERLSKGFEPEEYEKGILRMEVRLYNRHLNYKKRVYNLTKELKTYLNKKFFNEYITNNLEKFIHKGDYYKITLSQDIIDNSKLTLYQKKFLKEFLIDVSRSNLTNIMNLKNEKGKPKYSYIRRRNALNMLEKLDINPISIPKNWKCKNHIENPLKYIQS